MAAFAMIAYLSHGISSFLLFSSLLLMITLGRSVPLIACCAMLLGACFPIAGGIVAALLFLYVLFHPTRRAQPAAAS
ncbi:MAG: hypothetical protein KF760_26790 [Candidatus Eremiobacteraeota bacterium]|nr:hypothetical protein [Candidatus Eremiobacteraeota bacterium]MCW5868842.1 hypothetical protein [Candidatus Eremiobacteraeota bacterium]